MHSLPKSVAKLFLLIFAYFCTVSLLQAQQQPARTFVNMVPNSPVKITLQPYFTYLTGRNYIPIRAVIENKSNRDNSWDLTMDTNAEYGYSDSVNYQTHFTLTVPKNETRTFELLCRIPPQIGRYNTNYYYLNVNVSGNYVAVPLTYFNSSYHYDDKAPWIALSPSLYQVKNKLALLSWQINDFDELEFDFLPQDWRAYSHYKYLFFSSKDWRQIPPTARSAILDAVYSGVQLRIVGTIDEISVLQSSLGKGHDSFIFPKGFGVISLYAQNNVEDLIKEGFPKEINNVQEYSEFLSKHPKKWQKFANTEEATGLSMAFFDTKTRLEGLNEVYKPADENTNLTLASQFDSMEPPAYTIIMVMILFIILIGPVNFWFFARGNNRLKLLLTTPIISLIFVTIIALMILIGEGIGGQGLYSRIVLLLPEEKQEVLLQKQMSQTNLIINSNVNIPESSIFNMTGKSPHPVNGMKVSGLLGIRDQKAYGDWFASKRFQIHELKTIRPSRNGILRTNKNLPDSAPILISQMKERCTLLYYRDHQGRLWKINNLDPGQKQTLEPTDEDAFLKWVDASIHRHGNTFYKRGIHIRKNFFYAQVESAPDTQLNSPKSIDWKAHQHIYMGPVLEELID